MPAPLNASQAELFDLLRQRHHRLCDDIDDWLGDTVLCHLTLRAVQEGQHIGVSYLREKKNNRFGTLTRFWLQILCAASTKDIVNVACLKQDSPGLILGGTTRVKPERIDQRRLPTPDLMSDFGGPDNTEGRKLTPHSEAVSNS